MSLARTLGWTSIGLGSLVLLALNGRAMGPAAPAAAAESAAWTVDAVHSSVVFCVKHMSISNFYGRFNDIGGTITLDGDKSSLDVTVKVASIDTANTDRDKHLKNAEFFDVEKFALATYKSKSVKAAGDSYEVQGEMTLMGQTRPLTVTLTKVGEGKGFEGEARIGLETSFTFKRSDFGLSAAIGPIGDEIKMIVSIEAFRKP